MYQIALLREGLLSLTLLLNPVPPIEPGLLVDYSQRTEMNKQQFTKYVIEPVLRSMGLYSEEAVRLLLMIMAHESRKGYYIKQTVGPAVGVYQMEPATHDDIHKFLTARNKRHLVTSFLSVTPVGVGGIPQEMAGNMYYATAMARAFFLRFPESLPKGSDEELAKYAKRRWNTSAGKATWQDYLQAYQGWK